MSEYPINETDLITYSKNDEYLNPSYSYILPVEDDFSFDNCIVVFFTTDSQNRRNYTFCEYFDSFDQDDAVSHSIGSTGFYVCEDFNDQDPQKLVKRIKEFNIIT